MDRTIIFLTGTHSAGKSALAKGIEERMSLPFFPSRAGEIQAQFGITASRFHHLEERLPAQRAIFAAWQEQYGEALKVGGVFDRCPLDFAAYMLSDVRRDTPLEVGKLVQDYVKSCIAQVEVCAGKVLLVTPLGDKVNSEDRGAQKGADGAYAEVIHTNICGLIGRSAIEVDIIGPATIEQRLDRVGQILSRDFDESLRQRLAAGLDEETVLSLVA